MTATAAITIVDSATSSSDLAWAAAAQGAPSGTAYLVREQTAGRGRRGAGWSSHRGGMYFSILLRPAIDTRHWFGLSFVAALAMRRNWLRVLAMFRYRSNGRTTSLPMVARYVAFCLRRVMARW